jgi:hypothetical protein
MARPLRGAHHHQRDGALFLVRYALALSFLLINTVLSTRLALGADLPLAMTTPGLGTRVVELSTSTVGGQAAGTVTISRGDAEVDNAVFSLTLLESPDKPPAEAQLSVLVGGLDVTAGGLHLPTPESAVAAVVRVSGLTAGGDYSGHIQARLPSGTFGEVANLTVHVRPPAQVGVLGAPDALKKAVQGATSLPIVIRSLNTTSVPDLVVEVTTLTNAAGVSVVPNINELAPGTALDLPLDGLASASITLSVPLERIGVYDGSLDLVYAGERHEFPISVTWELTPPTVEMTGVTNLAVDPGRATITFNLRDTSGGGTTVLTPQVSDLMRTEGSSKFDVAYSTVGVTVDCPTDPCPQPSGGLLTLGASQDATVSIEFEGIDSPGQYDGTVRVTAPEGGSLTAPFVVEARQPFWLAAVAIGVGALLSAGLTWFLRSRRPRRVRQMKLALLSEQAKTLDEGLDTQASEVLHRIVELIQRLDRDLRLEIDTDADKWLADIDTRLERFVAWLRCRAKAEATQPPDLWSSLASELLTAKDLLSSGTLLTDASRTTLGTLDTFESRLHDAVKAKLESALDAFEAEVAKAKVDHPDKESEIEKAVRRHVTRAREAIARLDPGAVDRHIAAGRDALDHVTGATRTWLTTGLADVSIGRPATTPDLDPALRSAADRISRELKISDALVAAGLLIVSVISGLVLLYIPDPTWGGLADVLVAFLWGLGLYQVGGSAFEGIEGYRTRFASPPAAP